jgi:aryl-alcohol dehydrogenase-like predicted oxidoreductase
MEYRSLGESRLKVSAITFGAWAIGGWMWGGTDVADSVAAIHAALDHGVNSIDTAPVYGFGVSEEIVGKALKGKKRDQLYVFTKFGLRWDVQKGKLHMQDRDAQGKPLEIYRYAAKDSVVEECERSLRRLGTDYIDLYQIHWPDATTPVAETMEALELLKRQGKIREAGVCNYDAALLEEAARVTALAADQVPYSMLRRDVEKQVIPWCVEHQMGILAYSPLQGGLLTGKYQPGHSFPEGDHRAGNRFYKQENISRVNSFLEKIAPIAAAHNATLGQLVLAWTIRRPGVIAALAGARNASQGAANGRAGHLKLSDEDIDRIDYALDGVELTA